jgi:hypothetical protein
MTTHYEADEKSGGSTTGFKTAVLICVIGFVALMANRALVAPGGHETSRMPEAPALIAPDEMPLAAGTNVPASVSTDVASDDNADDNHPASF